MDHQHSKLTRQISIVSQHLFLLLQNLLATTSTDGKCRVFSTFIKGVDTK